MSTKNNTRSKNHILILKLSRWRVFLIKCIKCMKILEKVENEITVRKRISYKYIYPVFLCSYNQFNNMLGVSNPEKELRGIEEEIKRLREKEPNEKSEKEPCKYIYLDNDGLHLSDSV